MAQVRYALVVSAATNSSINTSFSLVASNLPLSYKMNYWNETTSRVYVHIGTSLPTTTITDKLAIPAYGTGADDSNHGQPVLSEGQNVYMYTDQTAVVSNAVIINFSQ